MKLLLVEDFASEAVNFCKADGYNMIALSPMAAWRLDQAGISYTIPEHYGTWCEEGDKDYQRWFLGQWLPMLSDVSFIPLPMLMNLLTPLRFWMESFLRRAYSLKAIFDKCQPSKVSYLVNENRSRCVVDDDLFRKGGSLFLELFRASLRGPIIKIREPLEKERGKWLKLEWTRRYYDWVRTLQFLPPLGGSLRLCFANIIPDKMREARLRGHYVTTLPKIGFKVSRRKIPDDFLSSLFNSVSWFSKVPIPWCVAGLEPQLTYFLEWWEPKVWAMKEEYKKYLADKDFSYIIFNRRNSPHRYAAHMAAKEIGLKTVYVRHGWDPMYAWERQYTRFDAFDYYWCPTQMEFDFYKPLEKGGGIRCEVI